MRKLTPREINTILDVATSDRGDGFDSILASNERLEVVFACGELAIGAMDKSFLAKNLNIPVKGGK